MIRFFLHKASFFLNILPGAAGKNRQTAVIKNGMCRLFTRQTQSR